MIYGYNVSFKDEEIAELKEEVYTLQEEKQCVEDELQECERDFDILNDLRMDVIAEIMGHKSQTEEISNELADMLIEMLEDVPY